MTDDCCNFLFPTRRLAYLTNDASQKIPFLSPSSSEMRWYTLANYGTGALPSVYGSNQMPGTAGNVAGQFSFYAAFSSYGI